MLVQRNCLTACVAVVTALLGTVSVGHAGNGNNGNSGKIGIRHLEADGTYILLQLKAKPAMNHLEKHSFDGEGDRPANDQGTCEFETAIDWGFCPCVDTDRLGTQ